MIQAAPLIISFARVVPMLNKLIGAVGITELGNRVNNYIQENPDESEKIFQMIMPSQGIANILKNKSSEGDEEVSEDIDVEVEEKPKKLSGKEKGMRIKEAIRRARAGRGNYSSPDAEGPAVDIRGSVIREVEDMGLADKDLKDNYDPDKPKFDYKKFIRRRKADGGAIGIEVLFEEKKPRKNFFMGGPALEGQALNIYNSMNSYGFQDQEIADALSAQGLYTAPGSGTPETPPTTIQPIGFQSGNDGPYAGQVVDQTDYGFNKKNYAPGEKLEINPAAFGVSFPDQPSSPKREGIINQAIDSFTSLPTRSLSSFASPTTGGNIVGPAEQGFMGQTLGIDPAGRTREEIRSLYDDYNRFTGRTSNFADARVKGKAGQMFGNIVGAAAGIPFLGKGIDMLSNAFGPRGDKSLQSKYTVDGAGFGSTGGRDEFGLPTFNKKDGFLGLTGNTTRDYTNRMKDKVGDLTSFFERTFKERGLGDFDIDNLDIESMKTINGFYTKQLQAYKQRLTTENINTRTRDAIEAQRIQEELAAAAAAKDKAAALAAIQKQGRADYNPNIHGPTNYGRDSQGNQSFDSGQGFGIGSDGGPVSNRSGRGRTGASEGGLATMFKEKR